jgi:hypothetical protein
MHVPIGNSHRLVLSRLVHSYPKILLTIIQTEVSKSFLVLRVKPSMNKHHSSKHLCGMMQSFLRNELFHLGLLVDWEPLLGQNVKDSDILVRLMHFQFLYVIPCASEDNQIVLEPAHRMAESLLRSLIEVGLDLNSLPLISIDRNLMDVIESLCSHSSKHHHAVLVQSHFSTLSSFWDLSSTVLRLPVSFEHLLSIK